METHKGLPCTRTCVDTSLGGREGGKTVLYPCAVALCHQQTNGVQKHGNPPPHPFPTQTLAEQGSFWFAPRKSCTKQHSCGVLYYIVSLLSKKNRESKTSIVTIETSPQMKWRFLHSSKVSCSATSYYLLLCKILFLSKVFFISPP